MLSKVEYDALRRPRTLTFHGGPSDSLVTFMEEIFVGTWPPLKNDICSLWTWRKLDTKDQYAVYSVIGNEAFFGGIRNFSNETLMRKPESMITLSQADKYRELLLQSRDPKSDIALDIVQIQPQEFTVRFFIAIDTSAKYLLVIHGESELDDPRFKLVAGSDLYQSALKANGSDKSLQNGVYEYLKQYGKWIGYESLCIEVHKFNSTAIFKTKYEVKDEKIQ